MHRKPQRANKIMPTMYKFKLISTLFLILFGLLIPPTTQADDPDTVWLTEQTMQNWKLTDLQNHPLHGPIDMALDGKSLYLINEGTLYQVPLAELKATASHLQLTPILSPTSLIEGYPIKELVAVEVTQPQTATNPQNLYLLDKSNDLYRYRFDTQQWSLEIPPSRALDDPPPLYLNLASYDDRVYLLDPARNQIWRYPQPSWGEANYLPDNLPWQRSPNSPDVTQTIDLAIDGLVYTLDRAGTVVTYSPLEVARYSLPAPSQLDYRSAITTSQPIALALSLNSPALYVADRQHERIVMLDRRDGSVLYQLVAEPELEFSNLRALVEWDNQLLLLVGSTLYRYDLNQLKEESSKDEVSSLSNTLPPPTGRGGASPLAGGIEGGRVFANSMTLTLTTTSPTDPNLGAWLAEYNFQMPLKGAELPYRSAVYPGSRRAYRYGVHQGIDFYGEDVGLKIDMGTPVYAVAAGGVKQVDHDYQPRSVAQIERMLDQANAAHVTSPEILERLNGRQIWLDHGDGVMTRYSHLSDIVPSLKVGQTVQAGQRIGYVGLSGTLDGAKGNYTNPHLHFEIRFGSQQKFYAGQGLTLPQTRLLFEQIFAVPVHDPESEEIEATSPLEGIERGQATNSSTDTITYQVQAGDTLFSIGQQFGLPYQRLAEVNDLTEDDFLQLGQILLIPTDLAPTVLGYSTGGWPIELYSFGDGSRHVTFIGGIHGGYEWNSTLLAYRAIDHFATHPDQIPDSITLEIIPTANPDGLVKIVGHSGRFSPRQLPDDIEATMIGRFNDNRVDLNRNWDCHWQPEATWGDLIVSAGDAPFSEVETQILQEFLTSPPKEAVIFWHSAWPAVFAGGCDEPYPTAEQLAEIYRQASNYYPPPELDPAEVEYVVIGDATDWLATQQIPAITVELTNHEDIDWMENLAGIIAILEHVALLD
ncbi:peptidoglycan DD-metalloendopeptidase family protein [Anaerolineales bacterium HSG25]|nr:peptidoglycan DD-metalloendopeptidase family protein [Anaerolineales bacterium HSG25]